MIVVGVVEGNVQEHTFCQKGGVNQILSRETALPSHLLIHLIIIKADP